MIHWNLAQDDGYGEFDYRYTGDVLRRVIDTLDESFVELSEITDGDVELAALHRRLNTLDAEIVDI